MQYVSLIQKVAELKNLSKAWRSIKSGKSEDARKAIRGIAGISIREFEKHEKPNLENISKDLLSGNYNISPVKGYFRKKKQKKEYRLICTFNLQDSIVQASILLVIKEFYYQILNNGVSYCGIPTRSKKEKISHITAFKNAHSEFSKGNYYVFESDIKSFFDSINKELLIERLFQYLPDNSLNEILRQIVYFKIGNRKQLIRQKKGSLPHNNSNNGITQGSPLSPFFANVYLSDMDWIMKTLFGTKYIRYVDDFILLSTSEKEVIEMGGIIEHLFSSEGLNIAYEKTAVCNILEEKSSIDFLGLRISKYEVKQKIDTREVIKNIEKRYLSAKQIQKEIKRKKNKEYNFIDIVNNKIQGYTNYYNRFHTQPMLKAINKLIEQRRENYTAFHGLLSVDVSGKKQFMTKRAWQSAFHL